MTALWPLFGALHAHQRLRWSKRDLCAGGEEFDGEVVSFDPSARILVCNEVNGVIP